MMQADMANQEHLDILAKGVETWNAWRKIDHDAHPNLRGAALSLAKLSGVDLSDADLLAATLSGASLEGADLEGAKLVDANLSRANLSQASLRSADLGRATLADADLSGSNLRRANLSEANLRGADLDRARVALTVFTSIDLGTAKGLDTVRHMGPSSIGIDTIYRSGGKIPESFLRGAGVPETFIRYIDSLTGAAFEFFSCFISYSTKDQAFAERLHADLQAKGVRCWFAPHSIQGGRKIHEQIEEAIKAYDKLLLILSDASMSSEWVSTEISKARKREGRGIAGCCSRSASRRSSRSAIGSASTPTLAKTPRARSANTSSPTSRIGRTTIRMQWRSSGWCGT